MSFIQTTIHIMVSTLLSVGLLTTAHAGNYYVATTGNDGNAGTVERPFQTIRKALSLMRAGDTVYLRGGTYTEVIDSNAHRIPSGTSWDNPVTITAYPREEVILKPHGGQRVIGLDGYKADTDIQYIIFSHLILDGANTFYNLELLGDNTGEFRNVHHIRFHSNTIRYTRLNNPQYYGDNGVLVHMSGYANEFIWNRVFGAPRGYGFYISGDNHLIEGCDIFDNYGYAIQFFNSGNPNTINGNIVRGNRMHNNGWHGNLYGAGIMTINHGNNNQVYNNLFYNNPAGGIDIRYANPDGTKVYNNTFYNNGYGVYVGGDGTRPTNTQVRNNIFYRGGTPLILETGSGTVATHNLLDQDPRFVSAEGGDFRVQDGSPAIDAGVMVEVSIDHDGKARPAGRAYDQGAYEAGADSTPPPPPAAQLPAPQNLRVVTQ